MCSGGEIVDGVEGRSEGGGGGVLGGEILYIVGWIDK
jgi:hypothetical protein